MKSRNIAYFVACAISGAAGAQDLAQGFRSPPESAKPHTWWHWMNGNVSREGITADLEAMKRIGLGGAQIFNVSESIPDGPAPFMSAQWRELFKHAAETADRLGIELCVHNCAGWSSSGGPWVTPANAMQQVVTSETKVTGGSKVSVALAQPQAREGYYRDVAVLAFPTPKVDARLADHRPKAGYEARYGLLPQPGAIDAGAVVAKGSIVDVTERMNSAGTLEWDAPPGEWTVLRIGHTPTGAVNAPSPVAGRGLEVDKFSREAFDAFWNGMMATVIKDLGPLAGKTLNNSLIDSYEVGHQNWTAKFRQEFKARRGYDLVQFLPVLTGRVVESAEVSERFLWDFRRTIADLFADNYYTYFVEKCHANGMLASIEPYDGPFECFLTGRDADIPMGEFWVGGGESTSCKLAASVAHTYGRTLVGAESFTAGPDSGRWQNHPYSLKALGDLIYAQGVNRFIIHRYAHQPWMDKVPGMTMGQWGTHFERTTTWWDQGGAWVEYLTRCQYMLQSGRFHADALFLASEAVPNNQPYHPELKAKGYDYDACNADVVLRRLSVKDGRLVLPDGGAYRVLVLADSTHMTPALLTKIASLVREGATVIGPRPMRSPSLTDLGAGDARVAAMSGEVWGDCDGLKVTEHAHGKGRVVWGRPVENLLAGMKVMPDCVFESQAGAVAEWTPKLAWIHRVVGDADVYFVSNQKVRAEEILATFRVRGKQPELWHPESGMMEAAPIWSEHDGGTSVPLHLDAAGSVFVVFRPGAANSGQWVDVTPPAAADRAASMPKIEITKAAYEAKDGAGAADVTAKVAAMVKTGETSIPANNASFGDPAYLHVKRLRIEYTLDGKSAVRTADENTMLDLLDRGEPEPPAAWSVAISPDGRSRLHAYVPGEYRFRRGDGTTSAVVVPALPEPAPIVGPWALRFPPTSGVAANVRLDALRSWTTLVDVNAKYFSGTAEYEVRFDLPGEWLASGRTVTLDLGDVQVIAEATLNGKKLGVWWKPPFAADVTSEVRPGANTLSVRVTNLWVNRLIGDEQHPDDCEWNGIAIKRWPDWMVKGTPRPVKERSTFTTWKHYTKGSPLVPSGLIGPVVLRPGVVVDVK